VRLKTLKLRQTQNNAKMNTNFCFTKVTKLATGGGDREVISSKTLQRRIMKMQKSQICFEGTTQSAVKSSRCCSVSLSKVLQSGEDCSLIIEKMFYFAIMNVTFDGLDTPN